MAVRKDEVNLQLTIGAAQAGNTLRDLKKEARDIRRALERIPVGTKEFDDARAKLKQVTDQIAQAEGKAKDLGTAVKGVGTAGNFLKNTLSTALGVLGAFNINGIIQSLFQFGSQLFNLGSNMDQLQAKTRTVFGEATTIVEGFAERNAESLGLARQQYINLATGVGDLLIPMGFAQDTAANLSAEIINQAGVLSEWSVGKVDTAQAAEILNKALLGERDALNSLGIDIKDSLVQAELQKRGLKDLTGEAKRQAEALVTLELITKQSASANEAFGNNTESSARKQARLRAIVQESIQTLATGFIPVVNVVLSVLIKAAEYAVIFGRALAAIPSFIYDNRAALILLATALVSFNAANIAAAAGSLKAAVATKAATIATQAQAAAQRILNLVLAANPIGLVVTAIAALAAVFVTAYQNSEVFRRIVTGAFQAVQDYVINTLSIFKDFGRGLANFFTGDFEAAGRSFQAAFEKMNPAKVGRDLKESFVKGFNSVPPPEGKVKEDKQGAEKAGTDGGKDFARAFSGGLDAEFAKLTGSGEKAGKAVADAAKKALDARLKEIEVGYLKEELVADRSLFNREISESEHAKRVLELKRTQYEQQIAAFKQFNQEETREALKAQQALLDVQQQLRRDPVAPLATLGGGGTAPVQSQFAGIDQEAEVKAIREKFVVVLQAEQDGELMRLDLQRTMLKNRLALLEEAGLMETEQYKNTLKEKERADEEYNLFKEEKERAATELSIKQNEAVMGIAQDSFDLAIDLLSRDEAARKKNAAAIKALQIGQVTVSGIAEVQKIWAGAAELGPIAGPIIGAIQTAIAVGRTVASVAKIQSQKFAFGGMAKFGFFGGKPHSAGGTKGFFEDGTMLEVERDEAFAVVNKRNAPMLRALSAINAFGGNGVPFFERGGIPKFLGGGLPTVNTNPVAVGSLSANAAPLLGNMGSFIQAVNRFDRVVQAFPTEVKSRVVYTELRDTAAEVAAVEEAAGF